MASRNCRTGLGNAEVDDASAVLGVGFKSGPRALAASVSGSERYSASGDRALHRLRACLARGERRPWEDRRADGQRQRDALHVSNGMGRILRQSKGQAFLD
jgi:hypothetical protein